MHPSTHSGERATTGYEAEATVAELTELVELQAAKISALEKEIASLETDAEVLRAEREELKTELLVAQRWVEELARRLEDADGRLATQPSTLRSRIGAWR